MGTGLSAGLARVHYGTSFTGSGTVGPVMGEAKYWRNWTFQVYASGNVAGLSLLFNGTLDPATAGAIGIPGSATGAEWFPLSAPSEQAGTGTIANPITTASGAQSMIYDKPLLAIQIVCNAFTGGGTVYVTGIATA